MMIHFDVDQREWGSTRIYQDSTAFQSGLKYIVIHWGGGTSQIAASDEMQRLRIWQAYHIKTKGWQDIAYNYAVGDSGLVYRLRGMNPGGHVNCTKDRTPEGDSYCKASIGIVWIGGAADHDGPSDAAKEAMLGIMWETGLETKGHRTVKEENGSWTACPGADWLEWINSKGQEEEVFTHYKIGDIRPEFEEITWLLFQLEGGVIDPNANSSQIEPLLGKTDVKLVTLQDFEKIAGYADMSASSLEKMIAQGLYRYGKEIAALKQFAFGNIN